MNTRNHVVSLVRIKSIKAKFTYNIRDKYLIIIITSINKYDL